MYKKHYGDSDSTKLQSFISIVVFYENRYIEINK